MFAIELDLQVNELSQKAAVGNDATTLLHSSDGIHQGHVVLQHQVSQDHCSGATHTYVAMDQDFT